MRIVKLSSLSEKERKKVLEEQEERYQQNQQERQRIQKQANDDFVNSFGNGDTNPSHTTTYKNVMNSMSSKEAKNNFKKNNKLTLWEQVKNMAGALENIGLGANNGIKSSQQTIGRTLTNGLIDRMELVNKTNEYLLNNAKDENVKKKAQSMLDNSNSIISIEKMKENAQNAYNQIQEKKNENSKRIQENIEKQDSSVLKKIAEINPSIGQMLPGMVGGPLGTTYFMTSASGNYYDDAKQRGMNEEQANVYSGIMGIIEGATEAIGAKLTTNVGKKLLKKNIKGALIDYGLDIGENFLEESIVEPISELMAQTTAGKDKANWNNMKERMIQSGIDGALTAIITGSASGAIGSIGANIQDNIENKKANKNADYWIDKAQQIVNENTDNKVINQENKTSQNGFSQAEKTEALRQEARNKLESIKQNYDENSYNQMQEFIETAPSEKALNQVINDLNKATETKQVAPLKQKQEVQLPMKQTTQNKSFEDVAFEAMNNYESNEVESPLKNRDMDSIGKQTKVNAYQYDNPQVKPYFQEMAQQMGEDLAYIASPENRSTKKGGGTKLSTSTKAMDILHNEQGYSYDQIAKGLQNIIDDKGSENNAISKKIELVIDEQLRNGYNNAFGKYVEPNQEYINTIQGNKDVQLPMKQKQEVSLPLNENVVNNQNTSQEQNQTISKDTNKVMNEVQNYIKNNDLDMTTDEFVEWASNVELENEENMTEQQKELYSLISDIQNRTNTSRGIQYHNIVNEKGSFIDKTDGKEYNVDYDIIPYITADEGKLKFIPYSQSEDFYKLSVDEMDKAVALCSEDANRLYLEGKTKGSSIGENYIYEYNITGEDTFGINKVEPIKGTTREVINEGYFETNSTETQTNRNEQRRSNNDNKSNSRDNRGAMQEDARVDREQSRQGLFGNERKGETNSKSIKNSKESSFSLPKNVKDIKNLNEFLRQAVRTETDSYWLGQLKEANIVKNDEYWLRRESPLKWKRELVQQYLDYKNSLNTNTIAKEQHSSIQGLENYNIEDVKEGLKSDIRQILEDNDLDDIDIVDLDLHGSRLRGTAKNNSDLDVVVQYDGDIREDALFDILNENPIEIDGIKVDINPIQEDIKSYMERSNKYDQEILSKNNNQVPAQDNQGRQLSKQQQEYFKDSKNRDENNTLKTMYRGDNQKINIFEKNKKAKRYTNFGTEYEADVKGFFFTDNYQYAEDFGDVSEYYLNTKKILKLDNNIDELNKIFKPLLDEMLSNQDINKAQYDAILKDGTTYKRFIDEDGIDWQTIDENAFDESIKIMKDLGYDSIEVNEGNDVKSIMVFESNQAKKIDNKTPTDSPDTRYELEDYSDNTAENEIQRKINRSMTMEQAKDMVQRAFVTGNIYDWFDGEYKNGDEWLAGVGASDVALVIDNDFNLQNKYVNANNDILNDEYTIDDVIEAYQNGTLTGSSENQTQRLDTSKDTGYKDDRFYAPKDITGGKELYDLASQRVTSKNRNEIYKARADFIINAHNEGYIESLGLDSKEVYEKLRSWTSYPKNALQTSMEINKGVSKENRWTGIENCSVVNELSVSQEQLDSLVKEIKGTSDDYQRRYISNTMLALDTHLNYKNLTFDFAPDATNMGDSVLGDYQPDYDVIRVKRDGQNTVSHEMGHYIDHLIGRELANGYNLGVTRLCRSSLDNMMNGTTFTQEQKQFLRNFANFLEDIENSSDIGSSYKMSSDEVFARFVARFTEWTRNVATGNRYGYEAKWYDDHFNQFQYKEFAKLLQEYSLLKTTEQASGRSTTLASQRTGQIQEQKIEDIFNELNKKKKTQENTEQSQKVQLPMKEKQEVKAPLKQGNVQQNQNNNTPGENINWNEIERPENNQKFRKHYRSIIESSNTTAEAKAIAKELMGTDTYEPETNKGQLAQADQRIMTSSPEVELQALRSRVLNGERITSVDIAVGERLIQYFSKTGSAEQLQDAIQTTALAGTSTGQTLQALTILNHQTPQGQVTWLQRSIDKMNKELAKKKGGTITTDADGNIQIVNKQGKDITNKVDLFNLTPEMMNKIMQSENQEQMLQNIDEVYEELGQQVPKSMLEKVDSWRYFSMLANPTTHIRNMVGNVAMGKMQRAKDKLAGGIEDVVSKFNPKMERTKTLRRADAKTKDFAKQDFKNMEVQSRLELNENKYNPQSRLQNARRTFKSNAMENTLGRLFNLNDKLLEAEDGIGLKAGYQKALADYITANKIDVDNITDAQLNKARNYAVQQAKEATFHQANAIASAISTLENKNIGTKLVVGGLLPFKKTPMNIAKAGVEYSPLQIAKSITYDYVNLRKGNISINQYIDNLSKGLTGTGVALVGYALANAGILKASGDEDKDKEKYDEDQGKQSYSIQIGGKTYSLDWLAPTGIPLFVGAEAYKLFNQESKEKSTEKSSEDDKLEQAIKGASNLLNAGATAINPMSEMSMISGLTNALSSYNSDGGLGKLGNVATNIGKSYINQFVPTMLGKVAKTTDEYERTTKSTAKGTLGKAVDQTINQIKNKIPGLRQTLPIKTDIWGKDLKQEVNLPLRAVNNFINPATVKTVSTDAVDKELNKLYEANSNSSILPDILQKKLTLNGTDYRWTNAEYAEYTKKYGQTSHELLNNLIKSNDYKNLTQEQKENAISNIYSYAKEKNKIEYAKKVEEEVKPSTLYTTMEEIKKDGGKQSEYLNYLSKTKGMSKESEKNKVLANSNYSNKTKEIIYTNGTGKDDNLYNNLLSKSNINMTEYLNYKSKITQNTNKEETLNYLNNNITGVGNRLLIAGKSYALQNNEKQKLAQYINSIANTREERIEIYKQLDKNFYVRNGKVYMRVSK